MLHLHALAQKDHFTTSSSRRGTDPKPPEGGSSTVAGAGNVAGLMTAVVSALPDLHAGQRDMFAQGDEVVVRLVVTGTQTGPILNIPASGKPVRWDAIDVYRLVDGKIAEEWAGEDFTAFLNDTGTYKAPWIQ
jgi:hypothetical protein